MQTSLRFLPSLGATALLGACGGGGDEVAGIPPPPSIITSHSYTSTVNLPLASHQLNAPALRFDRTSADTQLHSGNQPLSISFDKNAGTYTLSASDGSSRIFSAADRATTTGPDFEAYTQTPNNQLKRFTMERGPGVLLTYMMFGGWDEGNLLTGDYTLRTFVTGSFTRPDDMPTGSATYAMSTTGAVSRHDGEAAGPIAATSRITLSVDFQTGQVTTSLNLISRPAFAIDTVDYGTYTSTSPIAAATSSYAGQLQGDRGSGEFAGGFFGPKAIETGYVWAITGDTFDAVGNASGRRNLP